MKRILLLLAVSVLAALVAQPVGAAEVENPQELCDFLNRIGGAGAAARFETVVDAGLSTGGKDVFVVTTKNGKPCIKGNNRLAVTTGINWYLNHTAHINLAWNRLTANLVSATLPLPGGEERHVCSVDYRYYLNYCTFSYSMSTWTWERWQQEIDWMALHGINMPLQIVGLDVVWKKLLTKHLGYSAADADKFIAGPCFQAWWGMNNLEGWGGPNPDWWYARQEQLCRNILRRERELDMQPVLPGYSGMVPSDIGAHGYAANSQGNWCGFRRPYILDPNSKGFAEISKKYYEVLGEVMGTSAYYSMDPFHEGANTSGIDVPAAYGQIAAAMSGANPDAKWVIQFWQWSGAQYNVLDKVAKGKLIVLDLFSDAHTHFQDYKGHDAVYCMLHNFGGRTGFYGRLDKVMREFFSYKQRYGNIKGIGATPEAIETVPVLYDALFELPWRASAPDGKEWIREYTVSRYGTDNADAQAAWEKLRTSSLNCETGLQGPMEAVLCARPAFKVNSVSSWGGTEIFYDAQQVAAAAHQLLSAGLSGKNYSYDLTDLSRQALTDYAYYLLKAIDAAYSKGDTEAYRKSRAAFMQLMPDLDELLNTNKDFMLGRWTQMARGIADEMAGTTAADKDWLELNNARTLISTWGGRDQANGGGLRDYSYREWGGMMKDYYYPRWQKFFEAKDKGTALPDWYAMEHAWAMNGSLSYPDTPVGETAEVARRLFSKYFLTFTSTDGTPYYIYRAFAQDKRGELQASAFRGSEYVCPVSALPDGIESTLSVDMNNDGAFSPDETASGLRIGIPENAVAGNVKACLTLSDGTSVVYTLALRDNITVPRTVSVVSEDAGMGSVSIVGSTQASVTSTASVTIKATPATGYDFRHWTNRAGEQVSTENPYTYHGKEAETFTARFILNKWKSPAEDKADYETVKSYGQYVTEMAVAQGGLEPQPIYSTAACPDRLFQTTQIVNAARGSRVTLTWRDTDDADGLAYCRLSAYIDLNCDGDFEDEGEFLAIVGEKNSNNNTMLSDGSLNILLPYAMPVGITHVRLRFDSSWIGTWDKATDAMPAKSATKRMVYDVPLNVTEYAPYACEIKAVSADPARGTVDTNGHGNPYTVAVGEEVIIRAYASAGYRFDCWKDQYGRVVGRESTCTFKAPESGTYTAEFVSEGSVAIGNWKFGYDEAESGIVLTRIVSGSGPLDFTQVPAGVSVKGAVPGLFRGNTALTALTLPQVPFVLDYYLQTSLTGAKEENARLDPDTAIPAQCPFSLSLDVTTDGSTYNQWGSGLLATGNNALADAYDNGFQFYLGADGSLVLKLGSSENRFTVTQGSHSFHVGMDYDGDGQLTVRVAAAAGGTEEHVYAHRLNDITRLVSSIPAGVDIKRLEIADYSLHSQPFAGCMRLETISVAEGNGLYTSRDGILYDAAGTTLLVYPEGRFCTRVFTMADKAGRLVYAAPVADYKGSLDVANSNRGVFAAADAPLPAALWQMALEGDDAYKVCHLNSRHFFGGKAGDHDRMEMPGDSTQWYGVYTLSRAGRGISDVTLRASSGHVVKFDAATSQLTLGEAEAALADASSHWTLAEVASIPVAIGASGWTTMCLPVAVGVPTDAAGLQVFKVTGCEGDVLRLETVAGTIPAGEGVVVCAAKAATVRFPIVREETSPLRGNFLCGATIGRTGLEANSFYLLAERDSRAAFCQADAVEVPANSAYLPQTRVGASAPPALFFSVSGLDAIRLPQTGPSLSQTFYDLNGRRVLFPTRGVYVNGNGEKVFVR